MAAIITVVAVISSTLQSWSCKTRNTVVEPWWNISASLFLTCVTCLSKASCCPLALPSLPVEASGSGVRGQSREPALHVRASRHGRCTLGHVKQQLPRWPVGGEGVSGSLLPAQIAPLPLRLCPHFSAEPASPRSILRFLGCFSFALGLPRGQLISQYIHFLRMPVVPATCLCWLNVLNVKLALIRTYTHTHTHVHLTCYQFLVLKHLDPPWWESNMKRSNMLLLTNFPFKSAESLWLCLFS